MGKTWRCLLVGLTSAILSATAHGQSQTPPIVAAQKVGTELSMPAPAQFTTRHKMTLRGKRITYTAIAGETYLRTNLGEPIGSIFSFSYIKDGPVDVKRPVVFIFNG